VVSDLIGVRLHRLCVGQRVGGEIEKRVAKARENLRLIDSQECLESVHSVTVRPDHFSLWPLVVVRSAGLLSV
jgi:hypothetical protein